MHPVQTRCSLSVRMMVLPRRRPHPSHANGAVVCLPEDMPGGGPPAVQLVIGQRRLVVIPRIGATAGQHRQPAGRPAAPGQRPAHAHLCGGAHGVTPSAAERP